MSNLRVIELTPSQGDKLQELRDELCRRKIRGRGICSDISCGDCYLLNKFTLMKLMHRTLTNRNILLLLKDD